MRSLVENVRCAVLKNRTFHAGFVRFRTAALTLVFSHKIGIIQVQISEPRFKSDFEIFPLTFVASDHCDQNEGLKNTFLKIEYLVSPKSNAR